MMISVVFFLKKGVVKLVNEEIGFFEENVFLVTPDNAMIPLVRIGKGDRSLSVLSLSFKFQLVWLLMFCFRLHNSSKSIISGFTTFHHHDFSLQLLEKSTYKRR